MKLSAIAPDLWTVTQPLRFFGAEVGTRMTILRLPSGGLVLISPVNLDEAMLGAIAQLGPVAQIIAPNLFHHLFIDAAAAAFPEAKVWGVPGLTEKRPEIKVDGLLEQPGDFEAVLDYLPFQGFAAIFPTGTKLANEVVFCHRPSGSLIITDIAYNFGPADPLSTQLIARVLGSYGSLKPSFAEKWGTRDKAAVAASVQQVLGWEFDRVIMGHGAIVESGGKAQFKAGYDWFLG
jgi:hypothetical protein